MKITMETDTIRHTIETDCGDQSLEDIISNIKVLLLGVGFDQDCIDEYFANI